MIKVRLASLLIALVTCLSISAGEVKRGEGISQKLFDNIVKNNPTKYPKLWRTIKLVTEQNVDVYIQANKKSLGKAQGKSAIYLAPKMFIRKMETHSEDRLVVVIIHEFGHVLYNRQAVKKTKNKANHEYAAFKYSVKHALTMAEQGDTGPIQQLIKYLPIRMQKGKKSDPHTQALKKLTKEQFWKDVVNTYQ